MKLTTEQIRTVTLGAAYIEEKEGRVVFHRFTREQERVYNELKGEGPVSATQAAAGIRLSFRTDSRRLFLRVRATKTNTRFTVSHDIFVNGVRAATLDNFSHLELPARYVDLPLSMGEFEKELDLGEGDKTVQIFLPNSAKSEIEALELEDGAGLEPVRPAKKLLVFGDSITQGFDALNPSMRYSSLLADALQMEEYNKGIGGEIFFPELAQCKEAFSPDLITVAYGSNDWARQTRADFVQYCRAFFEALCSNYPGVPVFAITPIWRTDHATERPFGPFESIEQTIRQCVADLPSVHVISGWELVPHEPRFFGDLRGHPNNEGFAHYGRNLTKAIQAVLK